MKEKLRAGPKPYDNNSVLWECVAQIHSNSRIVEMGKF